MTLESTIRLHGDVEACWQDIIRAIRDYGWQLSWFDDKAGMLVGSREWREVVAERVEGFGLSVFPSDYSELEQRQLLP